MGEVSGGCTQALHILGAAPLQRVLLKQPPTRGDWQLCQEQFLTQKAKKECLQEYKQAGCCPAISWLLLCHHLCIAACSSPGLERDRAGHLLAALCQLPTGLPMDFLPLSHACSFAPGSD